MSQPPKSTVLAPAARCRALRGVVLSTNSPVARKQKGHASDACVTPLSFYLRDCGSTATCPFGGRPRRLSPESGNSFRPRTVHWPESLWVLPLRRRHEDALSR